METHQTITTVSIIVLTTIEQIGAQMIDSERSVGPRAVGNPVSASKSSLA